MIMLERTYLFVVTLIITTTLSLVSAKVNPIQLNFENNLLVEKKTIGNSKYIFILLIAKATHRKEHKDLVLLLYNCFVFLDSVEKCALNTLDKCYGVLPTDGSTPSNLIEVILKYQ